MANIKAADADEQHGGDGSAGPEGAGDDSLIVLGAEHLVNPEADADGGASALVAAADLEEDAAEEFESAAPTVFDPESSAAAAAAAEVAHGPAAAPAPSGPFLAADPGEEPADEFDDGKVTVIDRSHARAEGSGDVCPACGVTVAPGYPKCPRCKAQLAGDDAPRRPAAGGTSVVGRTVPWTLVAILAVATAVIVYLAEQDPGVPTTAVADDEVGEVDPAAGSPEGTGALLADRFAEHGFAIALEVDDTGALQLLSDGCDDELAPALVAEHEGALAAAGVTRVRCVAGDDEVIFERDLAPAP